MRRNRSLTRYIRDISREKSFSISSLSDCSLGRSPNRSVPHKQVSTEKRARTYRDDHYHKSERYDKESESRRKVSRSRSREDSRFSKSSKNEFKEKSYPSKPSSSEQKHTYSEQKKKPDDRLQRLEHMVELLVSSKSSQSKETPASSSGEFNPRDTSFTTSMWLNKINDECMERNFGEKQCLHYIQNKMSGLMKAWFKSLDLFDYTWPEIKMLIINTFPDNVDFAATLRLLVNRFKKPEETITQYYFSKMYLVEACKISGVNAVSCLIDGLNEPYWQKDAKSQNFQNPEILYTEFLLKLQNFGMQKPPIEGNPIIHMPEEHPQITYHHYIDNFYEPAYNVPMHPVEDLRQNIGISRLEKQIIKDSKKRCYVCGALNHLAAKCPSNYKCFLCHKPGHVAANCPTDNPF